MSSKTSSALLIGCGNMGSAILYGALKSSPATRFTVYDPGNPELQDASVRVVSDPAGLAGLTPDIAIVAVKPHHFETLPQEVLSAVANAVTVSVMAGVNTATMAAQIGSSRVVRVMPNIAAMIGQSMSVGFADPAAIDAASRAAVEDLFAGIGQFHWLGEEADIDAATAIAGSGPGFVFAFAEQMQNAACALGFKPEDASRLVTQTMLGAAMMMTAQDRTPSDLKRMVASPGGTTQEGLGVLEADDALQHLLAECTSAALRRARELSVSPQ